jgi:hypothetical protein
LTTKDKKSELSDEILESTILEKVPVEEINFLSNSKNAYKDFINKHTSNAHSLLLLSLTNETFPETRPQNTGVAFRLIEVI